MSNRPSQRRAADGHHGDDRVEALEIAAGDTVLVVGATGGVGSSAVQLAAAASATVIAPALADDEDYLRELGVDELLSREGDIVTQVRERRPEGVDAVLDLVSYSPGVFDAVSRTAGGSPHRTARQAKGRAGRT